MEREGGVMMDGEKREEVVEGMGVMGRLWEVMGVGRFGGVKEGVGVE